MLSAPSTVPLVGPELVVAVLGDVAHPRQGLVAGLLNDLEVADLKARITQCSHEERKFLFFNPQLTCIPDVVK